MAIHDIAPGFVVLTYASPYGTHKQTIPIANPVFALGAWSIDEKGTPAQLWTTAVTAFCNALKPLMGTDVSYSAAELYTKAVGAAPVLVDTATLSITGTGGAAAQKASELSIAFRTAAGGRGRVTVLDAPFTPNARYVPPAYTGLTAVATFVSYLLGSSDMYFGRDGAWPQIAGKALTKTNDALRHKYDMA